MRVYVLCSVATERTGLTTLAIPGLFPKFPPSSFGELISEDELSCNQLV